MLSLFKRKSEVKTKELIAQIHNEFNSAGNKLLQQAKHIIDGCNIEKAERLKIMGFVQTEEVKKLETVNVTKELANLVSYYVIHYPNYKFITEEQVGKINDKYGLVCAPVSRYKGFVPENKLSLIESFRFINDDKRESTCKVKEIRYSSQDELFNSLKKRYPTLEVPKSKMSGSDSIYINGTYLFMSKWDVIDYEQKFICAPPKEMDLTGLTKNKSLFQNISSFEVPDPVVLQPVKGGYLILAAWGQESSDEIVVNQTMN